MSCVQSYCFYARSSRHDVTTFSACLVAFSAAAEKLQALKVSVSDVCCSPIIPLHYFLTTITIVIFILKQLQTTCIHV